MQVNLTKIRNDRGELCKEFLLVDGKPHKTVYANLTTGVAEVISGPFDQLHTLMDSLAPQEALVHGVIKGAEPNNKYTVLTEKRITGPVSDALTERKIARTKDFFEYHPDTALAMLDVDADDECPHDLLTIDELIDALGKIQPQWGTVPVMYRQSSSAGAIHPDLPKAKGYHAYFPFHGSGEQLKAYMGAMFEALSLKYGWIKVSAAGSILRRGPYDMAVFSPERLDFAAKPIVVEEGLLHRHALEHQYYNLDGAPLDVSILPGYNHRKCDQQWHKREIDPTIQTRCKRVRSKRIDVLTAKGLSATKANTIITELDNKIINPDCLIKFDSLSDPIMASEILSSPEKYDGLTCADPLEPEQGTNKAKFYSNPGGTPIINSFIHGGIRYTFDERRYRLQAGKTDPIIQKAVAPIFPTTFADLMTDRLHDLNPDFYCGGKLREGFTQFGHVYNACANLNQSGKVEQIITPSATGSGKSVSARLYLAHAAKIGLSGMLVVNEIATVQEAVEDINKLAGFNVAKGYWTISATHKKNNLWAPLNRLPQVAVITHGLFNSRSKSEINIDSIRQYSGKQRDIIIIDERISMVYPTFFRTTEVRTVAGILTREPQLDDFTQSLLEWNRQVFSADTGHRYASPLIPEFVKLCSQFAGHCEQLVTDLRLGHFNIDPTYRGKYKKNAPSADKDRAFTIKVLDNVSTVLRNDFHQVVQGRDTVCSCQQDLAGKFGTVVILDATCDINPDVEIRQLNGHPVRHVAEIKSRDYSNVTVHVCDRDDAKQSMGGIVKNRPKKSVAKAAQTYLKIIGQIIEPDDKLLVLTFKDFLPVIESLSPYKEQVKFIYWGSRDARGSNEFRDFNKVLIIGWFRKDLNYYVAQSLALKKPFDDYVPLTRSIMGDAKLREQLEIAEDIIQGVNRIRMRTASDKKGGCLPCDIYLFTGGDIKTWSMIRGAIADKMQNTKFRDWNPNVNPSRPKKKKKKYTLTQKRTEHAIKYLLTRLAKQKEVLLKDLKEELALSNDQKKRLIKAKCFKDTLEKNGIGFIRAKGKNQDSRFVM